MWLKLPEDDASAELSRALKTWTGQNIVVPTVVAAMKHDPKALRAVMQTNNAISFGGSVLGRRREELVAVTVSAYNECFY